MTEPTNNSAAMQSQSFRWKEWYYKILDNVEHLVSGENRGNTLLISAYILFTHIAQLPLPEKDRVLGREKVFEFLPLLYLHTLSLFEVRLFMELLRTLCNPAAKVPFYTPYKELMRMEDTLIFSDPSHYDKRLWSYAFLDANDYAGIYTPGGGCSVLGKCRIVVSPQPPSIRMKRHSIYLTLKQRNPMQPVSSTSILDLANSLPKIASNHPIAESFKHYDVFKDKTEVCYPLTMFTNYLNESGAIEPADCELLTAAYKSANESAKEDLNLSFEKTLLYGVDQYLGSIAKPADGYYSLHDMSYYLFTQISEFQRKKIDEWQLSRILHQHGILIPPSIRRHNDQGEPPATTASLPSDSKANGGISTDMASNREHPCINDTLQTSFPPPNPSPSKKTKQSTFVRINRIKLEEHLAF